MKEFKNLNYIQVMQDEPYARQTEKIAEYLDEQMMIDAMRPSAYFPVMSGIQYQLLGAAIDVILPENADPQNLPEPYAHVTALYGTEVIGEMIDPELFKGMYARAYRCYVSTIPDTGENIRHLTQISRVVQFAPGTVISTSSPLITTLSTKFLKLPEEELVSFLRVYNRVIHPQTHVDTIGGLVVYKEPKPLI